MALRRRPVRGEDDIPMLGLFKERVEGAGHSYGTAAVRGFVDMTEEEIAFPAGSEEVDPLRLLTLNRLEDAFGISDEGRMKGKSATPAVRITETQASDDPMKASKVQPARNANNTTMPPR